jgi:choline dehydrogenase-like flavoprotein
VASRLCNTPQKPLVLLLEAGGSNEGLSHMSGEERFQVAFQPDSPLNWGFKTEPQTLLRDQVVDYSRGKGLGGSTAINFCGWVVGPREDYDEWSRLVGDDAFAWENAKRCRKLVENAHLQVPEGYEDYVRPRSDGEFAST